MTEEPAGGRIFFSNVRRSLEELTMGLDGSLNMSDAMEAVASGIFRNAVPGSWMAQMSTRVQEVYSLQRWFKDVLDRYEQLRVWTAGTLPRPKSVWLPGLFNPKAFITAVQQTLVLTLGSLAYDAGSIAYVTPTQPRVRACVRGASASLLHCAAPLLGTPLTPRTHPYTGT